MANKSLPRGQAVTLQSAATAVGNGNAYAIPNLISDVAFFIKGTGTIAGGVLTIEEADTPDYAGTWSVIGSTIALNTVTGGATSVVHVQGLFAALRARISTIVSGGGSVTVTLLGR